MQKINGEWIRESHSLPEDANFFIDTFNGSYSLRYIRGEGNCFSKREKLVRNGIIDYRINN